MQFSQEIHFERNQSRNKIMLNKKQNFIEVLMFYSHTFCVSKNYFILKCLFAWSRNDSVGYKQYGAKHSWFGGGHHLLHHHSRHRIMGSPADQRGDKQRERDACREKHRQHCRGVHHDRYM